MTAIKSTTSDNLYLHISDAFTGGWLFVDIERNGASIASINFPRAELLAALGVGDYGQIKAKSEAYGPALDLALARARQDTARAEAAEAKLEKVREWVRENGWLTALDAILNRPAPFTLPTEAGARFEAERLDGTWTFTTVIGRGEPVYTNDEDECWYTASEVMADWENHRLLDNNGAGPVTADDVEGLDSSDVLGQEA